VIISGLVQGGGAAAGGGGGGADLQPVSASANKPAVTKRREVERPASQLTGCVAGARPERLRSMVSVRAWARGWLLVFLKQYPNMRAYTAGEHCRFDVTFQGQPGNRSAHC
jgi:hypothetical protein